MMKTTTKKVFLLLISIAFSMAFIACEGPAGPDGPQGSEGPIGPAGEDGSVMHAGEGSPAVDLGKLGDFYLNTSAAEMYGPKTEEGWGVPFSLQGSPGEDGSQIYSGTSAPDASLGQEGDYYLNKSTFDLYGPKTASGWGTPINLQATTNVMYSVWMDIVWNSSDTPTTKSMRIPEPRITREFLNSGIVLMYLKQEQSSDGLAVVSLPNLDGNGHLYFIAADSPASGLTGILLVLTSVDQSIPLVNDYTDPEYGVRYVLIPGSEQIGSEAAGQSLSIDLQDYQQVQKYFGIRN